MPSPSPSRLEPPPRLREAARDAVDRGLGFPSVGFASAMLDTAPCVEALARSVPFP